nr:hypothetical protein [Tanacetum cinerariifolium]
MPQNIDFSGSDQIQTPRYHEIHPPSQETSDDVFQSNHSIQNKESFENPSIEIAVSNSNEEKEEPPQESDIHQLIEECSTEIFEEQKQSMEDTMLELVKICQEKEFLCIHDDVDDLIESALNSKILLINSNSQRLEKEQQEVKNVVEQPVEHGNRKHEHLLSMRYEHLSITPETESNVKNLLPIPSECEVALEDKRECDVPISKNSPVCDYHSDIFSNSKIDDDISDDDFEDVEHVEASLPDPEIVSVEEENVVQQEEEEVDFEDISQIQDIVLRKKLLSITRLISNIESLYDNPTPNRVLSSFASDNSLLDNFCPNLKLFAIIRKRREMPRWDYDPRKLRWVERFMNYLEEQTDREEMINSIKNGDQPLPRVTQVSIAGTTSTEQPPLKDKSMCNKTAKDLWDALARHMLGSKYGEQDRKAAKQEFVKTDNKRVEKKDDDKKRDMSKVKCYNCKKEGHFAKDCKKAKVKDCEYYKTKMLLAKKDKDKQVLLAEDQAWMESSKASSSSADEKISETDKSDVDHNDSEEKDHLVDKLIRKFNRKIAKCHKRVEKANQQSKEFENQNKDLQDKYDVLKNQTTTFEMNNKELNEQLKEFIEKNNDLLAQTKGQLFNSAVGTLFHLQWELFCTNSGKITLAVGTQQWE